MISGIIKKTQGTRSSSNGKPPKGSHSQTLKPSPYIEPPHRLSIPLEICTYRRNPSTTVQIFEKPLQWAYGKQEPTTQPMARKCNMQLCKWYKRKRAIKQLARYHEKEKQRAINERLERERHELERKAFEHFKKQAEHRQLELTSPTTSYKKGALKEKETLDHYHEKEERLKKKRLDRERKELKKQTIKQAKKQQQYQAPEETVPTQMLDYHEKKKKKEKKRNIEREKKELEKQTLKYFQMQESYHKTVAPKTKVKKTKKVKVAKKSCAKPKTLTKGVAERRLSRYEDLGVRFTNCFYRVCCQLYCCFTCILIIGFVVIVIL